jgi:hypothetical protein
MCSCPGDCEGSPECLDGEGGPLPVAASACIGDVGKLLWACRCGKGGTPDLRTAVDPEAARAETERQVLAHLREEGHDWRHDVYVGAFTAWCGITPPVSRVWRMRDGVHVPVDYDPPLPEEVLWHEAGTGAGPDYCVPWDGKLPAAPDTCGLHVPELAVANPEHSDPFADKAAQRGG